MQTGGLQNLSAAAIDFGEGIAHGDDDALDAGGEDGFGAGRGVSVMAARLKGDIERRATSFFASGKEGENFRVSAAETAGR